MDQNCESYAMKILNLIRNLTLIELFVIIVGLVAVVAIATTERDETNRTEYPGGYIRTVTHDSHKFVLTDTGGILHHPSCSCQDLTPSVISTLP